MFAVGTAFYTLRQCPVNDRQTDAVKVRSRRANTHTERKTVQATESYENRADIIPGMALVMSVRYLGKLELTLYGTINP